ncbi:MAG: ATP synthase F1 subunit delta [Acidobacteriota bacterium]
MSDLGLNYATALIDCLKTPQDVLSAGRDLETFGALVRELPALGRVLDHPGFSLGRRREILDEVLEKIDARSIVRRFLHVVVDKQRVGALPEMVSEFKRLADRRRKVSRAEVVTAIELDEPARARWERSLARLTGQQVRVTYRTDGSLVGGGLTRVGSRVYDGSIRKQLERIRGILLGDSRGTRS